MKLSFNSLPAGVTEGTIKETVVSINDDDLPADVDVEFEQANLHGWRGADVAVKVTLSEDPERTVTIPISKTNEGGASSADYSGVPATIAFASGETSKTFSFAATSDSVDDDGESVKLSFGTLPTGVTEGTTNETTVSITDDDVPSVTVSFGSATYSVDESDDTTTTETKENEAVVTVTLSADPERTVTIPITKANQDGASSSDYSGVPASVVFNTGETSKAFTFAASADSVDDDGESVKLSFGTLPTGVTEGTTKETVISITDDDDPSVSVSFGSAAYSVDETDDTSTTEDKENEAVVTVTLSADPERTVTIPITKANQGGASGSDYSGVPASVVFNSGETSKAFTFAAAADTIDDDDESVRLTFGTLPTGVTEGSTNETIISINDDDDPSVSVAFGAAAYSVDETDDASTTEDKENEAVVTVTLSADPERTVTIPISKANQGGASSADYSGVPASVVFNTGDTSKTFTFAATADTVDDDGESVKLTFGTTLPTGVTEGTTKETVVSITDDDLPADVEVDFEQGSYTVTEGSNVTVKVTLSEDPERTVTIPIEKANEGGTSDSDYSGVPASLTFNSGDTEKSFVFSTTADNLEDSGESVKLTFGTTLPTGVTEGTTNETVVSISNVSAQNSLTVNFGSASYSLSEGGTTTIEVRLSTAPGSDAVIPLTKVDQGGASSADYSGVPTSVTFGSSDTSKTFTFSATQDTVDDDGESVKLTFGTLPTGVTEGTTKETVVSITDDDVPSVTVSFGSATYSVEETDDTSTTEDKENEVAVTVTLSADPERTVTIPIVKADQGGASSSDYSGVPANVVFNSGDTSKTFTFSATQDTVDDDGESVKLTFGMTLPTGVTEGSTKETVVSITDDDVPSVAVSFGAAAYSVDETDDTSTTEDKENEVAVTVTLSADPERTVTIPIDKVNQDGASSSDYSGVPASVVFNTGETSKTFTFAATSDSVDDDDESVKLTFGTLPTGVTEGTTKETVISITDDDVPSDRLMSLVVTPKDIDGFDPAVTDYMVGMASMVTQATITSTGYRSDDTVTINGAGVTNGSAHTVDLSVGLNTFEVVVTSVGSTDPTTYKVYIGRGTTDQGGWKAGDDLDTLRAAGNTEPNGIWSDGTTIWLSDVSNATLYAYSQADGTRDVGKDIALGSAMMAPTGIWSDETTIWVIGPVEETAFAYTLSSGARSASSDISLGSDLELPVDMWSDGVTMWVVDSHDDGDKLYAYTLSGGARDTSKDISLASENAAPFGVWSDGATIWVTDSQDLKLYAYNFSGERVAGYDIDLHSRNSDAKNLWGNTNTLWVANDINDVSSPFNRIFTYNNVPVTVTFGSATYSVAESDDTATINVEENKVEVTVTLNADPQRQVVVPITVTNQGTTNNNDYSGVPASLTFESGETEKSFIFRAIDDTVEDEGESVRLTFGTLPPGVVGGTNAEAVVSIVDDDTAVNFEQMAYEATEGETVDVKVTLSSAVTEEVTIPLDKSELGGVSSEDYSGVPESLRFGSGETEKTITFDAVDDEIDDDGESVKLRFGSLPNGVVPGANNEATITITDDDQPVDRLMSLVVTPKDIDGFDPDITDYMVGVAADVAQATITATSYRSDDTITINGTEVTSGSAHTVDLSAGLNTLAVVVNSSATEESTTYTVYIGRGTTDQGGWKAGDDLDTLRSADNTSPTGVWSNGTTIWVADSADGMLYAYTLAGGTRDSSKDITLDSSNTSPVGIWSDGTTIWVADLMPTPRKVYAYTLSDGSRDSASDITLRSGNTTSWGIWSDGVTMWVVDWDDDKLYAYTLADNTQDSSKEFDLSADNTSPRGIWSDGNSIWVVDSGDEKLYAYDLSDGERVDGHDISLHSSNGDSAGIWANGDTAWVVNGNGTDGSPFDRVYTYNNIPVAASFEQGTYTVAEGSSVTIKVVLSADPERTVTVPISKANQAGASNSDYSGVPASVVFDAGETSKTFSFAATADTVDDDGELVKLTFGTLPTGVTEGTTSETVISITDDDVPSVTVSFGAAAYSVDETDDTSTTETKENEAVVTVTLSADPERSVTIPIVKADQDGASSSDYSGVPASVVFNAGEIEKTFTFTATADSVEDDGESVKLTFGTTLPSGVAQGSTAETVVSIIDDDATAQPLVSLQVSFQGSAYLITEGWTTDITVVLSDDPERSVTIPLITTQSGAIAADYSGVPTSLTFESGDRDKSFTFTAVQDEADENDESVTLGFGDLPDGVSAGFPSQATVTIVDALRVSFGASRYQAHEGGFGAVVAVQFDSPVPLTTVIPINATGMNGATDHDWDGVPAVLTFSPGDQRKTFTVTAYDDEIEDDGESVELAFGILPTGVVSTHPRTATVELMNTEDSPVDQYTCPPDAGNRIVLEATGEIDQPGEIDYWRVRLDPFRIYFIEVLGKNRGFDVMGRDTYPGDLTLELPGIAAVWDDGRHLWIQGSETPLHNQFDLISGATPSGWHEIEVRGYGGTGTYQIKVRVNNICIDTNGYEQYPYFGGPDGYMLDVPGDETTSPGLMDTYSLSWRSVTGFLGDNWSWYREGEPDVDWVRVYLKANQEYTAELWTEDIYPLEHQATDLKILGVHDSNGDLIAGTPSSNSGKKVATTFQPATDGEYYLAVGSGNRDRTGTYSISIQGRNPGESANRLRSVSSDDRETKGEDSTEVGRDTKLDDSTTNSPVTGAPSISGTAKVGETLSADTSTIRDADGLRKAVFTYQWTADGSEITGATAVSYTVVVRDEGKAIRVKVFFTDDAGNREAVTSYATSPVTAQTDGKLAVSVSRIDDTDGLNDAYQRLAYGVEVSHGGALALSSESRGRSFNFLGTTGSPVLFDIKYSGTDEFKMLVVDSEEYGGRYERLLTPRRLSGPYEGVRALVYKGGEFEDQEEAAGAFNVRVEGDGAWELKIRLPDFGVPPVTMAKGIGDDVVGPWDLRSPNPFVADFHFAITHEGRSSQHGSSPPTGR